MYIISQYINDIIMILIIICTFFLYHILQDMIYIFLYTSTRFYRYLPYYMYIFNLTLKYTNVQIMMLCTETINMYFMYIDLYMMQYYMHRSLHQQTLINNNNRHIANILSTSPNIVNVLSTYHGDCDMYRSLHHQFHVQIFILGYCMMQKITYYNHIDLYTYYIHILSNQ